MNITLEQARTAIQAAIRESRDMGIKMNIAVVDAGANLVAFARMNDAWLGSVDIAIRKAKTARYFDMPTGEPLYQIEMSNGGLISFPGGIPIKDADDKIIGAISVSGSTGDDDHAVAKAGVKALEG